MRWKVGEDLPDGLFNPGGEVRNMKNPLAFGDPDRMRSLNHRRPRGEDGGGVHANSGVNNKAASLMTDGGTWRSHRHELGSTARRRLRRWPKSYEVQTNLLTSASDYQDLHANLGQGCRN